MDSMGEVKLKKLDDGLYIADEDFDITRANLFGSRLNATENVKLKKLDDGLYIADE